MVGCWKRDDRVLAVAVWRLQLAEHAACSKAEIDDTCNHDTGEGVVITPEKVQEEYERMVGRLREAELSQASQALSTSDLK